MAEESINTPVTLGIVELEPDFLTKPSAPRSGQKKHPNNRRASTGYGGNSRKNSVGESSFLDNGQAIFPQRVRASTGSFHDVVDSGINSNRKSRSSNSGESAIPHYLRASTGSCHDFCKYGRKHTFEVKTRQSTPKRVITVPSDWKIPTESGVPEEMKTTKVVKPMPFPISKSLSSVSPSIIKQEAASPSKKVELPSRKASSNEKKKTSSGKRTTSVGPKIMPVKQLSSPDTSGGLKGRRNSETKIKQKTGSSKAAVEKLLACPAINRVQNSNVKKYGSLKPLSPLKDQNKIGKSKPKPLNSEVALEESLHLVEAETEEIVMESTQNGITAESQPKEPNIEKVLEKMLPIVEVETEVKVMKSTQDGCTTHSQPKEPHSEVVLEKTSHVVKAETEDKVMDSTQNGSTSDYPPSPLLSSPKLFSLLNSPALSFHEEVAQEEFECTDSETDEFDDSNSGSSETVSLHEVETSGGIHERAPRKAGIMLTEDKDCAPMKLKFRRGKVVDLQYENSGPSRLRFRRGRVLGENEGSKDDFRRRRFRKRGVDDMNRTIADSEKVILRHQDVQGKKDAQGLFNIVIEETASKLVESRKSKVKALVGAFETVISLQDCKPPVQTVT